MVRNPALFPRPPFATRFFSRNPPSRASTSPASISAAAWHNAASDRPSFRAARVNGRLFSNLTGIYITELYSFQANLLIVADERHPLTLLRDYEPTGGTGR